MREITIVGIQKEEEVTKAIIVSPHQREKVL
jgi:hypothetical protein